MSLGPSTAPLRTCRATADPPTTSVGPLAAQFGPSTTLVGPRPCVLGTRTMPHETPASAPPYVGVVGRTAHVASRTVDDVVRTVQRSSQPVDVAARSVRGVARIVHASRPSVDEVTRAEHNIARHVDNVAWAADVSQPTVDVLVRAVDAVAPNVRAANLTRHVGGWPAHGDTVSVLSKGITRGTPQAKPQREAGRSARAVPFSCVHPSQGACPMSVQDKNRLADVPPGSPWATSSG